MNPPEWKAKVTQTVCTQDSNRDGVVNSLDANFNQLRVWRDLNQDGISQAGELQTLSQAGIASMGVAGTTINVNLAVITNGCAVGNTHIASGSFTRSDGGAGRSGTAELTGSYLLAGNIRRYIISSCSRNMRRGYRFKKHKKSWLLTCKKGEISKQLQAGKL
jgi:hypothetical protein